MKLTFEQIKDISVGAVRIWQDESGIAFARCTQKQIDAFTQTREVLGERAKSTASVRLHFNTDAKAVRFRLVAGTKCELFVNGVLRKQYNMKEETAPVLFTFDNGLGETLPEYQITIYFPCHGTPGILDKDFELIDATYCKRHQFDRKILFYGDSITQGWDSKINASSYANRISRFFNAESLNLAVSGAYTLKSIFDGDIDFDPDVVIVALGTNDFVFVNSFKALHQNIVEFLNEIKKKYGNKKIFVITPIWRADREVRSAGEFQDIRKMIARESDARGFITVDGLTLVPPIPDYFSDLIVHPNDDGFSYYAENLAAVMVKYIL